MCKPERQPIFLLDLSTYYWKLSTWLPVLASVQRLIALQHCSARKRYLLHGIQIDLSPNQQHQTMMPSGAITRNDPNLSFIYRNTVIWSYQVTLTPYCLRICWLGEISDVDRHGISTHRAWYFHGIICWSIVVSLTIPLILTQLSVTSPHH